MKITVLTVLAVIVLAYVTGLFYTQNLHTEITIDAPPEVVWNQLTDFDSHPQWNPFIRNIAGRIAPGSRISVTIQPPGGDAMEFEPELLVVKQNRELRWLGRVLIPKLFDGEHYFALEARADGGTQFVQGEDFSGILALALWGSIEQDTKRGFEAMNEALKSRSEAGQ